jgi:citronellol/citronellal dehydrogenase
MFKDKTVFITGASRGIGKAIALRLAREGANIAVIAKSVEENPKLGGTIYSAAKEIGSAGGKALAIQCDIRDENQVHQAVEKTVASFGGIDILVNNASAISLTPVESTEAKRYDLIYDINVRGTFFVCKSCLPFLRKGNNPHILSLSPPLNMDMKWFANHPAYTISKYNMTMITLAIAAANKQDGIGANTLWPRTVIATAAIQNLPGGDALVKMSRKPEIIADAAFCIFSKNAADCSGNSFIDEDVLKENGIVDLDQYAITPGGKLFNDLFI